MGAGIIEQEQEVLEQFEVFLELLPQRPGRNCLLLYHQAATRCFDLPLTYTENYQSSDDVYCFSVFLSDFQLSGMSANGQAAVHYQLRPIDKCGAAASQKQGGLGDIRRGSTPPYGMESSNLFPYECSVVRVLKVPLPETSIDIAGTERIHADAPVSQLERQVAGERNQSSLESIGGGVRECMGGMDRADVDDRPTI